MKKEFFFVFLAVIMAINISACAGINRALKDKFVRKKDTTEDTKQIIRTTDEEERYPNAVRYKMHYVYWDAWMTELINYLGESRKKDTANCLRALENLEKMAEFLTEEKARALRPHVVKLTAIKKDIISGKIHSSVNKKILKRGLNKLWTGVKRDFAPYKLEEKCIKPDEY